MDEYDNGRPTDEQEQNWAEANDYLHEGEEWEDPFPYRDDEE